MRGFWRSFWTATQNQILSVAVGFYVGLHEIWPIMQPAVPATPIETRYDVRTGTLRVADGKKAKYRNEMKR